MAFPVVEDGMEKNEGGGIIIVLEYSFANWWYRWFFRFKSTCSIKTESFFAVHLLFSATTLMDGWSTQKNWKIFKGSKIKSAGAQVFSCVFQFWLVVYLLHPPLLIRKQLNSGKVVPKLIKFLKVHTQLKFSEFPVLQALQIRNR